MAKVSEARRQEFQERSDPYQKQINESLKKEKEIIATLSRDNASVAYKKIMLCELMISVATTYIAMNNLSVELLDVKNNDMLNEARKILYKAIIYLEEIVTPSIDVQYSEIEEKVLQLEKMPFNDRYTLIRKLGLAIRLLTDAYGDNTKWRWAFVELQGRFVTVAKNLVDWKKACKDYLDTQSADYDNTVYYIRRIKKLLDQSGSQYRDRYELSTHRLDDIRIAINYVVAERRICMLTGEKDTAEELKKKALVWREKMEHDKKNGVAR
ncbi:MAG: hypothetical protein K6G80_01425 [Treponema sp.]|nr:hypothetical protein [Treponema sp.]